MFEYVFECFLINFQFTTISVETPSHTSSELKKFRSSAQNRMEGPSSVAHAEFAPRLSASSISIAVRSSESSVSKDESTHVVMTMDEILGRIGTHRMQWLVIMISSVSYAHYTLQTLIPTYSIQSIKEHWSYLQDKPVTFNSVLAGSAFARLVGSICLLPLLDRFGRRNFIMISLCVSVVTSCVAAASPNFATYAALRSLTIFVTSVLPGASTIYSVELVKVEVRSICVLLCQCLGCIVLVYGAFMAGGVGAQDHNPDAWRWVTIASCAPTIVPIIGLAYVWVETPRFLMAVKRDVKKAWQTLTRMSKGGDVASLKACLLDESGDEEATQATREPHPSTSIDDLTEAIVIKGVDEKEGAQQLSILEEIKGTVMGMWSLLRNRDKISLTYTLAAVWALQSFSHWGLSAYMTVFYSYIGVNVTWTTASSFLVQLPSNFLLSYLLESPLGRVGCMKLYASLCSLVHIILAIVLAVGVTNQGLLMTLAMLCYFFGGTLWGIIYAYSAEMYPTTLRSSALSLFSTTNAIAAIATTYVGSVTLDEKRTWIYPLVWGILRFCIVFCAMCWKKETAKAELEDCEESS
eukprot:Blabericola_migrator_1__42@NODE_100_length_14362_cov_139_136341_g85_i1_p2_GENE_NODE_100_length_14362_cov_139_136341_g85_i1NODE_100_length_14362_cov_139_136341_g85_i1_p2_ORF_typecomplete_len579_score45_08Sugar_tr/PF00083_24/8_5e48MFS_1/PF07690_16/19MFS_1/PF07690_16/4_8e19MFS_1/PF07690_16/9_3e10TRI12/PF06609_13/7_7e11TRI12/PF06609_13/1_1e02MFS_2/PF13347_6/7_5e06MFS_2/PF13347_6/39MFS_2/PF13347_6/0_0024MFS_2/PF13347_6/1_3e02MFS_1_like/PF12832_7/0_059MFS_1_like/PF12832_7/0_00011MFS_3/PF05977_13/0_000